MSNDLMAMRPRVPSLRGDAWRIVLEAWLNTLDSANTRRAYRRSMELALADLGDLELLDAVALTNHRQSWVSRMDAKDDTRLSPATVLRHLSALRSFLSFARITGQVRLSKDVIELALKLPKAQVIKPYEILTEDERKQLIAVSRGNTRDRVLITLALATGLRAMELCNLTVGDITQDEQGDLILRVRSGKGRKDRLIPLDDDTAVIVRAYLLFRKLKPGNAKHAKEFFFASRKGKGHGGLSTSRVRGLIDQYVNAAEIKKPISTHSLRHTFAIRVLGNGASVPVVQKLLGHVSLATTQRYANHFEMQDLKDAVR